MYPSSNGVYNVTAVVLSGGSSNNFSPITEDLPKPLLKVCGKTLLYHVLYNLTRSEFKDVLVVTNEENFDLIKENVNLSLKLLKEEFGDNVNLPKISTHFLPLSEDGHSGTIEVLNYISNFVNNDFVVLPVDIYGNFDFKTFLKEHFKNPRMCTVAFVKKTNESLKNKKDVSLGGNDFVDWYFKYRVITTLDEDSQSLLGISQFISLENYGSHGVYKWHLPRHPKCIIDRDLVDVHVYAFSKHIFELVNNDLFNNSSIRLDLIPYLVKVQNTPFLKGNLNNNKMDSDFYKSENSFKFDKKTLNNRGVFYYICSGESFKFSRINSIDSLYLVNIQSCFSNKNKNIEKNTKHKNILLGLNTNLSETSEIKNSIIGNNVTIGNNVKITDSLIMDNCTIEDNNVLGKCVLGFSVFVEEQSNLKNTIVKSGTRVPKNTYNEKDYIPSFM